MYTAVQNLGVAKMFFKNKWSLLFSKNEINWSKVAINTSIIKINKRILKTSSTTVSSINSNKNCFLTSKSPYYNDLTENSALHHWNKSHLKIYLNRESLFLIVIIFHNITVITVFVDQINALLVSTRDFFITHYIILPTPNFWIVVY